MANPHLSLGSAIYSVLSGGTVSVHHTLNVQGGTPPYCIFQPQVPGVEEYTFTSSGISADYVVKVVSNRLWPTEAATVYTHLHNLMQDAALSAAGYTVLRCRRTSSIQYRDGEGYWHVGGMYRIDLHES